MKLIFEYDENNSKHLSYNSDFKEYIHNACLDSPCNNNSNNRKNNNVADSTQEPGEHFEIPKDLIRNELPIPNVSEPTVVRHYTNMSHLNYGIDLGFYPLGSCTMKYNPKINEDIASLNGFKNLHPFSYKDCVQGSLQILWELEQDLKVLTGMDAFSLQPSAGAQAELLGAMITKAYFREKNQKHRTKVIIPDSAHGTNPATAKMCKLETITIPSDTRGNMDIDRFQEALHQDVALVMLTNPNTLGLFEEKILDISDLAHKNGTLMYCDGANMNAMMGITKPSDQGFDFIHLNLHKTFSTPHGGGGPGSGVLGVKAFLEDYLPTPRIVKKDAEYALDYTQRKSIGSLRYCYGNFAVLVRAYSYIRLWGNSIRKISENAILNANYLMGLLRDVFNLPFDRPCAHEFVISSKGFGEKSAFIIAKRLMDYGFHPPTIYFPLTVKEALMIEPTETESKETLDRFACALKKIAQELTEEPDFIRASPHTTHIGRLDEVSAARTPDLRWTPKSSLVPGNGK
jgi:glycine dehydrogenase subunit 2